MPNNENYIEWKESREYIKNLKLKRFFYGVIFLSDFVYIIWRMIRVGFTREHLEFNLAIIVALLFTLLIIYRYIKPLFQKRYIYQMDDIGIRVTKGNIIKYISWDEIDSYYFPEKIKELYRRENYIYLSLKKLRSFGREIVLIPPVEFRPQIKSLILKHIHKEKPPYNWDKEFYI